MHPKAKHITNKGGTNVNLWLDDLATMKLKEISLLVEARNNWIPSKNLIMRRAIEAYYGFLMMLDTAQLQLEELNLLSRGKLEKGQPKPTLPVEEYEPPKPKKKKGYPWKDWSKVEERRLKKNAKADQ